MFVFKETKRDIENLKVLKEYQYGNPYLYPYSRTIINADTGENIGVFCGFLTRTGKIAKAKVTSPDTLFMIFDSVDQATFDFYCFEIQSRRVIRPAFLAYGPLVRMKLEYKNDLEEIIVAFHEHIKCESGCEVKAMYSLNMYQSESADRDGYYVIDNDDYPGFELIAPSEDGDPGLLCRREF